ncbi:MAG: QacE family quaternary ammonium compound efflux SMR transporter [Chloroflexi bacterium]|nr:MAG: QacE family quaternary ammonium compound efflux SMR transporter [Chloroflexota bacterium]
MGWILLFVAITFEILGTTSLKLSNGFTRIVPSIAMFIFYGVSFSVFSFALKYLNIGVAYAVWSGVGTSAIAIIGYLAFKEQLDSTKIIFIGLILVGVIGLNLSGGHG